MSNLIMSSFYNITDTAIFLKGRSHIHASLMCHTDVSEAVPVELPLKVLHVVVTLSVVGSLSLCEVLQTSQVVELMGERRRM